MYRFGVYIYHAAQCLQHHVVPEAALWHFVILVFAID